MKIVAVFSSQDRNDDVSEELQGEGYLHVLHDKPLWAIIAARETIIAGKAVVDGKPISLQFAPTAPQLNAVVSSFVEPLLRDLRDLEKIERAAHAAKPETTPKLASADDRRSFADRILSESGFKVKGMT